MCAYMLWQLTHLNFGASFNNRNRRRHVPYAIPGHCEGLGEPVDRHSADSDKTDTDEHNRLI